MKRLALIAVALVCAGYFVLPLLSKAGATPAPQPPLIELNDQTLPGFIADFNNAKSETRAILLLSPSCPTCLQGATAIQNILAKHPERSAKIFVIWQPILPTDWARPGTRALHRLSDSRVRQFWDADHRITTALRKSAERRPDQPDCCERRGLWWDLLAVFHSGELWTDQLPQAILVQGTVKDAASQFERLIAP